MKNWTLGILISAAVGVSAPLYANVGETDSVYDEQQQVLFSAAQLDRLLAPVALYPDTLLTHVLIAATHPLDLIQAQRWRASLSNVDNDDILDLAAAKNWDPSVVALTPFADILNNLANDLDWLDDIGQAMISQEDLLLARVQVLREQAYQAGNLVSNEHIDVDRSQQTIVIQPVRERVVYVPAYNPFETYGHWRWHNHAPVVWVDYGYHHHGAIRWNAGIRLHTRFFFSGFHWHRNRVVVNYNFYHTPRRYHRNQRVHVREFHHWRPAKHYVNQRQYHRRDRQRSTSREYQAAPAPQHRSHVSRVNQKLAVHKGQHGDRAKPNQRTARSDNRATPPAAPTRERVKPRDQGYKVDNQATTRSRATQQQERGESTEQYRVEKSPPSSRQRTSTERQRQKHASVQRHNRQERTHDRGKRSRERQ